MTNRTLLTTLLATSLLLLAAPAAAEPINAGGLVTVDAEAAVHANADGAQHAAAQLVGDAKDAAADAAGRAHAEAAADAGASAGILGAIQGGIASNAQAVKAWFFGLFGQAKGAASVDARGDVQQTLDDAQHGQVDARGAIDGRTHVDAKSLAPPQPDAGFLGSVKAGLQAMLHLG